MLILRRGISGMFCHQTSGCFTKLACKWKRLLLGYYGMYQLTDPSIVCFLCLIGLSGTDYSERSARQTSSS